MSPVTLALLARGVVLLVVVVAGREIGMALMRVVVAAAQSRVPGGADAVRLVEVYWFPATLIGTFLGVVAAQVWLRLRRARAGDPLTMWLSVAMGTTCALAAPALLWLRAGARVTEYPEFMYGVSVALAGFLPPVAAIAAMAWWWIAVTLPLPRRNPFPGRASYPQRPGAPP